MPDTVSAVRRVRIGVRSDPVGSPGGAPSPIAPLAPRVGEPHVADWHARVFVLRAPFSFRCRAELTDTAVRLHWIDNPTGLPPFEVIAATPKDQWRAPDRPSIQWLINTLMVADEPVQAETMAPFQEASMRRWPGVILPGTLDIQRWTRPFQWVFEWQDLDRELDIRAGEPLQYVRLQAADPQATFELVPLPQSHELQLAMVRCAKIAQFKRNALSHIDEAFERRPPRLVPDA